MNSCALQWKEVGAYCQDVTARMDNTAILAWKNDPEASDESVSVLLRGTQGTVCGLYVLACCTPIACPKSSSVMLHWCRDVQAYPMDETTHRFCGAESPGIGVCDPAETECASGLCPTQNVVAQL